jgi:LmbE family N-acetylglucosaminyl deacetylase
MNGPLKSFRKTLVFAAHPDDETIACSGLLQRTQESFIVFAVDGAPPHYGYEKKFGSLQQYSEERFREAGRALRSIPNSSFRRLTRQGKTWFLDQHLFVNLPEAFASLLQIAQEFSPDLLVSHAFEGGHIDHDACHILAKEAANTLTLPVLEFPLYWRNEERDDVFQEFRDHQQGEFALKLSEQELAIKARMLSEYQTQCNLTSVFRPQIERFRPMNTSDCPEAAWSGYPFENRRRPLKTELFLRKIVDFHRFAQTAE